MKQHKILLLASIAMLFTTSSNAGPVNMAPIISYLLSNTVTETSPNTAPIANAGPDISTQVNQAVTITGTATDTDGTVISYEWKNGNTLLSDNATFTYTPTVSGVVTLTLTVIDDDGLSHSDSTNITATAVVLSNTQVKKTGQTKSYAVGGNEVTDGSIKDDGFYQTGIIPSYTRTNGVVTDHLRGVEWQDDYSDNNGDVKFTNGDDAVTYCSTLLLSGGGWRLPSIVELQDIVVYSELHPSIDTTVFLVSTTENFDHYWSSTSTKNYPSYAWTVRFFGGFTSSRPKTENWYVRCVRDEQ